VPSLLALHATLCDALVWLCLRIAVAIDEHRRRVAKHLRRLAGSIRRLRERWLRARRLHVPERRGRHPWNRTPPRAEEAVVRLHVEQPDLGAGQLRRLAERVLAFRASRETIRRILIRRRDLIADLEAERPRPPRRIDVSAPRRLWGADLTLVWILGCFPVWLFGAVDYHGSRIVALERLPWPTTTSIIAVLDRAFVEHGVPQRVLTDRGCVFTSDAFGAFLAERGARHTLTRPAHPWTNGRIERLFRTFKHTVFTHIWLFTSTRQIDRFCRDFVTFYNRDRPHERWAGRTPDEVHRGLAKQLVPLARVSYFDDHLRWYRFG
jgi:putative transposase